MADGARVEVAETTSGGGTLLTLGQLRGYVASDGFEPAICAQRALDSPTPCSQWSIVLMLLVCASRDDGPTFISSHGHGAL
jgi:hypothetical protein